MQPNSSDGLKRGVQRGGQWGPVVCEGSLMSIQVDVWNGAAGSKRF